VHVDLWRLFWAKTDRERAGQIGHDPTWTRPLWAHLLDVAHAALVLWERVVPDGLRRQIAADLGLSDAEAGRRLAFWIGLHDWGKATPGFFFQTPEARHVRSLRDRGFDLPPPKLAGGQRRPPHHGHATIAMMARALGTTSDLPLSFRESLVAFVGFHHGRLVPRDEWYRISAGLDLGDESWKHAQMSLLHAVWAAWTARYGDPALPPDLPPAPDWLLGLAGWATLADWLGSMAECFDRETGDDLDAYLDRARSGAEAAFAAAGFLAAPALAARPFAELFPNLAAFTPYPVQQALLELPLPSDRDAPTLTIIEAPTGEGKTEAALALAARQQDPTGRNRDDDPCRGGGLYLGLPTQATANGLMGRVTAFLENAHRGSAASFRLAYGRAELHEPASRLVASPATFAALVDESDGGRATEAQVVTLGWFLGSKRALLAPYGLGTIDQALLGVLFGRHFFLRLFALAGKTVIVDEVHAYGVYTGSLVRALLPWLRAVGAHVILLSATLHAPARRDLLAAWDPDAPMPDNLPADPAAVGYPAVWTSAEGRVRAFLGAADGLTAARSQSATLLQGDPDPMAVAEVVRRAVDAGAVVAVVCNTIRRAQAVFCAVERVLGERLCPDDLRLFHARFVRRDRAAIEDAVIRRFGKGRPPGPAVLVGTQVVEQSLDLDVDVMLSDLAPVDLLLQRAGRLHRHGRDDRPADYARPLFTWLCPGWEGGSLPDVEALAGGGHIYARTVLWRTARVLGGRPAWTLPADYRPLLEAVYGADDPPADLGAAAAARWASARADETSTATGSLRDASDRLIDPPGRLARMLLSSRFALADDDDESAHASLRALTREGESVEAVVFHADATGALFLDPDCRTPAPLTRPASDRPLSTHDVRAILGASVRLSSPRIVAHLRATPPYDDRLVPWRRAAEGTASLRGLHPLVMTNGVWDAAGVPLHWHDRLGLVLDAPPC